MVNQLRSLRYQPIYFSPAEFKRCSPSCSIEDMSDELLYFLDRVRNNCGFPLIINSAYRSKEYELKKGRSGTSSHSKGLAVDIRCTNSMQRAKLIGVICELCDVWNYLPIRIGIGKTFIHVDIDRDKSDGIWLYD